MAAPKAARDIATMKDLIMSIDQSQQEAGDPAIFNRYKFQILNPADGTEVAVGFEPTDTFSHTFFQVPTGDYNAAISIVDSDGNALQAAATFPFSVPSIPSVAVPTAGSVQIL